MTVNTLPSSAEIISATQQNAEQKVDFSSTWDFLIQKFGKKSGQGPQTVASAASVDLDAVIETRDIVISGNVAITGFIVEAGKVFRCTASGASMLTNNASIVTNTGTTLRLSAGDSFVLRATATDVVEVLFFTRAGVRSQVRLFSPNGYGSSATAIRRYVTSTVQGTDITYADSTTAGTTLTINTPGVYSMYIMDQSSAIMNAGVSLNSNQLTTTIISITAADRLAESSNIASGNPCSVSVTAYLPAGSVIRPHCDGTASTGSRHQFTIVKVSD